MLVGEEGGGGEDCRSQSAKAMMEDGRGMTT